jgi:tetratricopeptide (TPR) repeat protein
MSRLSATGVLVLVLAVLAGCAGEDPDVRRGNLFFQNKQFDSAFKAYEQATARDPKLLDLVRENLKKSYYYYGGSLEMGDSLDGAIKYYEKGFALDPTEVGMCEKLAKYYWEKKNWEKAANFYGRLVELDGEAPDTEKKWALMGQDYYALGYANFQSGKYKEAVEAFQNSLKVAPKGNVAAKCREALAAAQEKVAKVKGQ